MKSNFDSISVKDNSIAHICRNKINEVVEQIFTCDMARVETVLDKFLLQIWKMDEDPFESNEYQTLPEIKWKIINQKFNSYVLIL